MRFPAQSQNGARVVSGFVVIWKLGFKELTATTLKFVSEQTYGLDTTLAYSGVSRSVEPTKISRSHCIQLRCSTPCGNNPLRINAPVSLK